MKYIFNYLFSEKSGLDQIIEEDNFEFISTSIFISNPIFIVKKKNVQEFLIFKVIEKSSYLIEYLGSLNQDELEKFNLNNIYYITPGKNDYELISINSEGDIISISIYINENKKLAINNFKSLLNIELNLNHKLSSDIIDFKPIYSKNTLNGIVIIENSIDVDENLWLFYKKPDNDILTFSTFVENELFIYYDFREVCHLFFLQHNQVWYLQFKDISEDSIENFADILSLDEANPIIHDFFFYRNYIYIRTEDFLYKYHSEYLILEKKERVDKSNFVKQSYKSPHILIGKKGNLYIRNDPEAEPYIPVIINPDYDEINLQYEDSPKFISIFKSDLIIIKTKKELILASLFFDKRLTYLIKKRALKKFNFFEELAKKPQEFRERVESQLGFLKRSVELEIDGIESKTFRPPKIIQFFTKDEDIELLNNLYNIKTYNSFAKEWNRNPSGIYFHVKRAFDIPRCDIHPKVKKTCKNCQERLSEWRENGLKKIETIKYRESLTAEVFSGVEKDYYTAFIKKKYFKRIQKTFEFYDLIHQELWNKTIDYVIPLSMEGHSFEVVLAFGLHEILENYYNIKSYDSVINDPMFQYFLIIDREFHKYWKPNRIAKFMQKHHIKTVEISNRILRTQQLFVNFIYTKIKEDFFSFIDLMADKLSQLLKINLSLSSQPMRTIVAGLFGKLYKLFPKQFQKKYTQSEISNELQITEVTLRKATKDKKYAILDNFINKCWEFYNIKDINQSKKKDDFPLAFLDEKSQRKSQKKELDEKIEDSKQELIEEIDLDELDIFDENGVFWCNCGKSYLASQRRYIIKHIKNCPEFSTMRGDDGEEIEEVTQETQIGDELIEFRDFIKNGVFCCNCGKKYLVGQRRYILQHIDTCSEFGIEKEEDEEKSQIQTNINESNLEELVHFDANGVFWCNCGKNYLPGQKRYILQHIKTCLDFNPELKEAETQSAKNKTEKGKQKKLSNFFNLDSLKINLNKIIEVLSNEWKSLDVLVNDLNITDDYDKRFLKLKLKELEKKGVILFEMRNEEKYWKIKL